MYHHFTIYVIWWAVSRFGPGGDAYYCVILNSFVHVVMYGYYLSVSLGVPLSFIKPYITMMQLSFFLFWFWFWFWFLSFFFLLKKAFF